MNRVETVAENQHQQLRNTLGKLDQALGCINESIVWVDKQGRIAWSNTVFNQLMGRVRIQILGVNIDDIMSFIQNGAIKSPSDVYQKVVKTGCSEIVTYEKHGNTLQLEIFARTATSVGDEYSVIVLRDVTRQQKILDTLVKKDKELTELGSYLNGIVKSLSNMLIVTTPALRIKLANRSTLNTLGYKEEDLLGKPLAMLLSGPVTSTANHSGLEGIKRMLKSSVVVNQETSYITAAGDNIPVLFSASVLESEANNTHQNIICVAQNISQQKKSEADIAYLATHDTLTSLPNRMEFEKTLTKELSRSSRHGSTLAVLFIDLDNFKHINDALGHHMGDQVLCHVSNMLRSTLRKEDTVARLSKLEHFLGRLGGDEFVVLLTGLHDDFGAVAYANRILDMFAKTIKIGELELRVGLSIGIATASDNRIRSDTLIKHADMAMYRAKEMGRNNFQFYSSSLSVTYNRRLKLETGLYHALEEEHFHLVYQPQCDLTTNTIRGMETLLRWEHPDLGPIPPDDFIPIAEKSGLIVPIGEWVIRQACRQYQSWKLHDHTQNLKLSINISAYQLIRDRFTRTLQDILKKTDMNPQNIEFEITETAVMTDLEGSELVLSELKNMGIQLSIDDFGTGYSSLTRIKELPINTLKIDKSFIQRVTTSQDDAAIVRSIIGLTQSLDLNVIAEGVETAEQVEYLKENGCSLAQGYYFSRPLVPDDFIKLLNS